MELFEEFDRKDPATCKELVRTFLGKHLNPAFGTLSKKEMELSLFELLQELGIVEEEPSIYSLTQRLHVTRAKARILLYDWELRHSDEEDLRKKLRKTLEKPLLQKQGDLFAIEIESPRVQDYLRSRLKTLGFPIDGTFGSHLVRLKEEAMAALIEDCLAPEERTAFLERFVRAGAPDRSFRGVLLAILGKIGEKCAGKVGEVLVHRAEEVLRPVFDQAAVVSEEVLAWLREAVVEFLGPGDDGPTPPT